VSPAAVRPSPSYSDATGAGGRFVVILQENCSLTLMAMSEF